METNKSKLNIGVNFDQMSNLEFKSLNERLAQGGIFIDMLAMRYLMIKPSDSFMSKFNNKEFYSKLLHYNDLSYRRYNKLSEKEKNDLSEYDLLPEQLNLTLKLFHLLKTQYNTESIHFSVNVMSLIFQGFQHFKKSSWAEASKKRRREIDILKELKFRGFKRYRGDSIVKSSSYIVTIHKIKGRMYYYPLELSHKYQVRDGKRMDTIWDKAHKIHFSGYTQIIYPGMPRSEYPNGFDKFQINNLEMILNNK